MDRIPLFDYVATGIPLLAHRQTATSRLGRYTHPNATQEKSTPACAAQRLGINQPSGPTRFAHGYITLGEGENPRYEVE
ncbi:MAG: hypothetical protein F9K30_21895 [Dechloromonas sp.]|nr:MAG: hypothetical protein F9K30_21895 [Dechloromonas sp.]